MTMDDAAPLCKDGVDRDNRRLLAEARDEGGRSERGVEEQNCDLEDLKRGVKSKWPTPFCSKEKRGKIHGFIPCLD